MELLEQRQLLTGVTWSQIGNNIHVFGTSADDTIGLRVESGDVVVDDGAVAIATGVSAATISEFVMNGYDGNDSLTVSSGISQRVSMYGGNGDDVLQGGAGNDIVRGDAGSDILLGGAGDADWLWIDQYDIQVDGQSGTNNLIDARFATAGVQIEIGGVNARRFWGSPFDDFIDGTGATSGLELQGFDGEDTLIGGPLADYIYGGNGDDVLAGADGNDLIRGDLGEDVFFGGNGDDTMLIDQYDAEFNGGDGNDLLHGAYASAGLDLNLVNSNAERVYGSNHSDLIDGSGLTTAITVHGYAGDDTILGGLGNDTLLGSDGNDTILGGGGSDSIIGEAGDDHLQGGDGDDVLTGSAGIDSIYGNVGNDHVIYDSADDVIDGGAGVDIANAGYSAEGVVLDLAATHFERFWGSPHNDFVTAATSQSSVHLLGMAGNDTLIGSDYHDILNGYGGDDLLVGGLQLGSLSEDSITEGDGDDVSFVDEMVAFSLPADDKATFDKSPAFTWAPAADAASYQIWINQLSTGTVILNESGLTKPFYQYSGTDLPAGDYRVWIRKTDNTGAVDGWDAGSVFNITSEVPVIHSPSASVRGDVTVLSWSDPAKLATSYTIWLNDVTAGTTKYIYSEAEKDPFYLLKDLNDGHLYRYWVQSHDSYGGTSAWSVGKDFHVSIPAGSAEYDIIITNQDGLTIAEDALYDTVAVVLTKAPSASVTVSGMLSDSTEASLSAAPLVFDASNWSIPQTVKLTGVDDLIADGHHLSYLTLLTNSSDTNYANTLDRVIPLLNRDNEGLTSQFDKNDAGFSVDGGLWQNVATYYQSYSAWNSGTVGWNLQPENGRHKVYVAFPAASNRSSAVAHEIWADGQLVSTVNVNQKDTTGDTYHNGKWWTLLGQVDVTNSDLSVKVSNDSDSVGYIYAQYLMLEEVPESAGVEVKLPATTLFANEGETSSFEVTLKSIPSSPVVFTLDSDSDHIAFGQNSITFTPSNWSVPQVVSVTANAAIGLTSSLLAPIQLSVDTSSSAVEYHVVPEEHLDFYVVPPNSAFAGDFDGDGVEDAARIVGSGIEVSTSGGGTFDSSVWPIIDRASGDGARRTALDFSSGPAFVGDFNGDGSDDLLSYSLTTDTWRLAGSARGEFFADEFEGQGEIDSDDLFGEPVVGDFNGDGRDDLALKNIVTGQWNVVASVDLGFEIQAWEVTSPDGLKVIGATDVNADGRDDVISYSPDYGDVFVAVSTGTTFETILWGELPAAHDADSFHLEDADADGDSDLFFYDNSGSTWAVLTSSGSSFSAATSLSSTAPPTAKLVDLNGDGLTDFAWEGLAGAWNASLSNLNGYSNFSLPTVDGDEWFSQQQIGDVFITDFAGRNQKINEAFLSVRNEVRFSPSFGALKGAAATAQTAEGNAWDQASLLAEKLEGVAETRLRSGRVEATGADLLGLQNWLGTYTDEASVEMLEAAGLSPAVVGGNGSPVTSISFDHAWIEVQMLSSTGFEWHALDPSWKQHVRSETTLPAGQAALDLQAWLQPENFTTGTNQFETTDDYSPSLLVLRGGGHVKNYAHRNVLYTTEITELASNRQSLNGGVSAKIYSADLYQWEMVGRQTESATIGMRMLNSQNIQIFSRFGTVDTVLKTVYVNTWQAGWNDFTFQIDGDVVTVGLNGMTGQHVLGSLGATDPQLVHEGFFGITLEATEGNPVVLDDLVVSNENHDSSSILNYIADANSNLATEGVAPIRYSASLESELTYTNLRSLSGGWAASESTNISIRLRDGGQSTLIASSVSAANFLSQGLRIKADSANSSIELQLPQGDGTFTTQNVSTTWANDLSVEVEFFEPGSLAGREQSFQIELDTVSVINVDMSQFRTAGQLQSLALIDEQFHVFEAGEIVPDSLVYELISYLGQSYFSDSHEAVKSLARTSGVRFLQTGLGAGMVSVATGVTYEQDAELLVEFEGLQLDQPGGQYSSVSTDYFGGTPPDELELLAAQALVLSDVEAQIVGDATGRYTNSVANAFQAAAANDQTFYKLRKTGTDTYLDEFSNVTYSSASLIATLAYVTASESFVMNLLNEGSVLVLPGETTRVNSWTGLPVLNLRSDLGVQEAQSILLSSDGTIRHGAIAGDTEVITSATTHDADLKADLFSGVLRRSDIDLTLPADGLDFSLSRTWRSSGAADSGFGQGWSSILGETLLSRSHISELPGSGFMWLSADGSIYNFPWSPGTASYDTPATLPGAELVKIYGLQIMELRFKDGSSRKFEMVDGSPHLSLTTSKDRHGNTLRLSRSKDTHSGAVSRVDAILTSGPDQAERELLSFEWDHGHVSEVTDYANRSWRYQYVSTDGATHLQRVDGPLLAGQQVDELTSQFAYEYESETDAEEDKIITSLVAVNTRREGRIEFDYYDNGRVRSQTLPDGGVTRYRYDQTTGRTVVADPLGRLTKFYYSEDGSLLRTVRSDGQTTRNSWHHATGQLQSTITTGGGLHSFQHDIYGNLVRSIDSTGLQTDYTYDPTYQQLVTATEDPTPNAPASGDERVVLTNVYGTQTSGYLGNPISTTNALNETTNFTYTPGGKVQSVTTSRGTAAGAVAAEFTTTFSYDHSTGTVVSTSLPHQVGTSAVTNSSTIDSLGRALTATDESGLTTHFNYDIYGLVTDTYRTDMFTSQPRAHERLTYTGNQQVHTRVDSDGVIYRYEYDERNRPTREIAPDGSFTEMTYNLDGTLASSTDAAGSVTRFVYDGRGRQVQSIAPDGTVQATVYNNAGQMVAAVDQNQNLTHYVYDGVGRFASTANAIGETSSTTYDPYGRVSSQTDGRGTTTTTTYDALDRVFEVRYGDQLVERLIYDRNGNVVESIQFDLAGLQPNQIPADLDMLPINRIRSATTTYDYRDRATTWTDVYSNSRSVTMDPAGRITSETNVRGFTANFEFDGLGQLKKTILPAANPGDVRGVVQQLANDKGQVVQSIDAEGNVTSFEYDAFGRQIGTTNAAGDKATITYDVLGRAVQTTDELGRSTATLFDINSREVGRVAPALITEGATLLAIQTFAYDSVGNRVATTDALGRSSTTVFDQLNRPITTTSPDPDGDGPLQASTTQFTYDENGNVASQTDARQNTRIFEYDELNRLTDTKLPLLAGQSIQTVTSKELNGFGEVVSIVDGENNRTEFDYDRLGRLITTTAADPDGAGAGNPLQSPVSQTQYDEAGNITQQVDALGRVTTLQYDNLGRLKSQALPDPDHVGGVNGPLVNPVTAFTYDLNGNKTTVTDAANRLTSYVYDELNRLTTTSLPAVTIGGMLTNADTSAIYDAVGNVVSQTDAAGRVTQYVYDEQNRQVRIQLPAPSANDAPIVLTTEFDLVGNVLKRTDALGHATTNVFDQMNRLSSVTMTDPDGDGPLTSPVTQYEYDPNGNLTEVTDTVARTTTNIYDAWNRKIETWLPEVDINGTAAVPVTKTSYDNVGNVITTTDARNFVTAYQYDALNRLVTTTLPDPDEAGPLLDTTTTSIYDAVGNVTQLIDNLSRVTSYEYDNFNRLTKTIQPDPDGSGPLGSPSISQTYNTAGNIETTTDPRSAVTVLSYDEWDRLLTTTYPDPDGTGPLNPLLSPVQTSTYDLAGNVRTFKNARDFVTVFDYDNLDRQVSVTTPDPDGNGPLVAVTTVNTFDAAGNLLQVEALGRTTHYTYDKLNRQVTETLPDPDGEGPFFQLKSPVTTHEYDDAGNLVGTTDALGRKTLFRYDSLNRPIETQLPHPDSTSSDPGPISEVSYDLNGNIVKSIDAMGRVTDSKFDGWNRQYELALPVVPGLPRITTTTVYDEGGRIEASIDHLNRKTEWQYDNLDRVLVETLPDADLTDSLSAPQTISTYDASGNVTSVTDARLHTTTYEYDALNRLTKTIFPAPNGQTTAAFTETEYDAAGNVAKQLDVRGHETEFEYDALDRLKVATFPSVDSQLVQNLTTYDQYGNVASETDALLRTTNYEYDRLNRLIETRLPAVQINGSFVQPTLTAVYDEVGNVTESTDAGGLKTLTTFDELDRPIEMSLARTVNQSQVSDGVNFIYSTTETTYDFVGNVKSVTDAEGRTTQWTYDELNRKTKEVQPAVPDNSTSPSARFVRIERAQVDYLSIAEVQVWSNGVNVAPLGTATQISNYSVAVASRAIDGNTDGIYGNGSVAHTYSHANNWWEVDLGAEKVVEGINVWGRTDYVGRLDDFTISVMDANRNVLWQEFHAGLPDTVATFETRAEVSPTIEFAYDDAGNLFTSTDPLDRTTTWLYDRLDRPVKETLPDPDGALPLPAPFTTTVYDNVGNATETQDHLSRVTTSHYDGLDRLFLQTLPDPDDVGGQTPPTLQFAYDAAGNLLHSIDAEWNQTSFTYDELARQETQTSPVADAQTAAGVTEYEYDLVGNLVATTDPLLRITTTAFDALNRPITTTLPDPDGAGSLPAPATISEYNLDGNIVETTDHLSRETLYEYDGLNRLTQTTLPDPDGTGIQAAPVMSQTYDRVGNVISSTDANGNVTAWQYDNQNRQTIESLPDPITGAASSAFSKRWFYDSVGNLKTETDQAGRITSYQYDRLDRVIEVAGPDPDGTGSELGSLNTTVYDTAGRVHQTIDRITSIKDETTTFAYDHLDRKTSSTDDNNGITAWEYDANGNTVKLTDSENNVTSWAYDGLDRVTTETNPLLDTRTYEYDLIGNQEAMVDRNGRRTEFEYDNLNRLETELWILNGSPIETLTYEYDAAEQLAKVSDSNHTYEYDYDQLGRLTDFDVSGANPLTGSSFQYSYDAHGNTVSRTQTIGTDSVTTNYVFDAQHRLASATQQGNGIADKSVTMTYFADSRPHVISRFADLTSTQLVATSTYEYDGAGRLTDLDHAKGATNLAGYDYDFNAAGWITGISSLLDQSTSYQYDDTGQLTGATHDAQTNEAYEYDLNGNRTGTQFVVGPGNRVEKDGQYSYEYDDEGNRVRRVTLVNGQPTGDITEYVWDYRNRLTSVVQKNPAGVVQKTIDYEYDVNGKRISKTVTVGATQTTTGYLYDGDQLVAEVDGSANVEHQYFEGPYVDQIFADENALGEVLWPLADAQGTVRDLARRTTAGITENANHRVLDSFGNITSETNGNVDHNFAFSGRYYDQDADLYYNRARWFDQQSGTFISEDPLGFSAGDANVTRYTSNDPVNFTDPSGLFLDKIGGFFSDIFDDVGNFFEDVGSFIGDQWDNGNLQKALLAAGTVITAGAFLPLAGAGFGSAAAGGSFFAGVGAATGATGAVAAAYAVGSTLGFASTAVNSYESFSGDRIGDGTFSRVLNAASIASGTFSTLVSQAGGINKALALADGAVSGYEVATGRTIGDGSLSGILNTASVVSNRGRAFSGDQKSVFTKVNAGIRIAASAGSLVNTGDRSLQSALRTLSIVGGVSGMVQSVQGAAQVIQRYMAPPVQQTVVYARPSTSGRQSAAAGSTKSYVGGGGLFSVSDEITPGLSGHSEAGLSTRGPANGGSGPLVSSSDNVFSMRLNPGDLSFDVASNEDTSRMFDYQFLSPNDVFASSDLHYQDVTRYRQLAHDAAITEYKGELLSLQNQLGPSAKRVVRLEEAYRRDDTALLDLNLARAFHSNLQGQYTDLTGNHMPISRPSLAPDPARSDFEAGRTWVDNYFIDPIAGWGTGHANVVTFGITDWAQGAIYGDDALAYNQSGWAYSVGTGTGVVSSVLFGYGAGATTGRLATQGALRSGLRAYTIGGDAIGVAQSSYNVLNAQETWADGLGFLPTFGYAASGLRGGSQLMNSGLSQALDFGGERRGLLNTDLFGFGLLPNRKSPLTEFGEESNFNPLRGMAQRPAVSTYDAQISRVGRGVYGQQVLTQIAGEAQASLSQANRILESGAVNTRWGSIYQRYRGTGGFREFIARRNGLHQEAELLLANNYYVTAAIDNGYVIQFNKGSILGARNAKGNLLRPDIQVHLPDGTFGILDFTTEGSAKKIFKYGSESEAPYMINITIP